MPGPGYKRGDLPGPSRAKNYKPKKRRKDRRHLNRQSRRATIRAARRSAQAGLRAANRAAAAAESQSTRAVTNYAAGTKTNLPTIQQLRTVWPRLSESERASIAPKIVSRAFSEASSTPGPKKPLPNFLRKYAPKKFDQLAELSGYKAPGEPAQAKGQKALKELQVDTVGEAVDLGLTLLPVGGIAGKAVKGAFDAAKAGKAARAVEEGAEAVVKGGSKGKAAGASTRVAEGTAKQGSRIGKVTKAAKSTAPARAARTVANTKGGAIALKTGKVGGKIATAPVRKPIKTTGAYGAATAAAATPAAIKEGDPSPIFDALKNAATGGQTVFTDAVHELGDTLDNFGIVGAAARDILELPVAAVPSVYLLGKGLKEWAVDGDDTLIDEQIKMLMDNSVAGGVIKGDLDQIKTQLREHPIFSLLEVSGGAAVAGRAAGAGTRALTAGKVGGTERKPLSVGGDQAPIYRDPYSKDLTRQVFQKARDRRRAKDEDGNPIATEREIERALKERVDRLAGGNEGLRRADRTAESNDTVGAAPRGTKLDTGSERRLTPPAKLSKGNLNAAGARYAVIGILRNTRTFAEDLRSYAARLDKSHERMLKQIADPKTKQSKRAVLESKVEMNRYNRALIDELAKKGDPDAIFASARANAQAINRELDPELVKLGLLDPAQAEKARWIGAARVHLDAKMGKPVEQVAAREAWRAAKARGEKVGKKPAVNKQLVDRDGRALSAESARDQLVRMGIDPENVAFSSLRPHQSDKSARYVPQNERPSLPKKKLTGKAVDEGAFDPSYEALLTHRVRTRGVIDATKAYDGYIREFEIRSAVPLKDGAMARDAIANPEKYGIEVPPGQRLVALRRNPFLSKKAEADKAADLQAKDLSRNTEDMAGIWREAENLDGPGPFAIVPETAAIRLREHFEPPNKFLKGMQVGNQTFKQTVLTTSPKWLAGNFIDINIRAILSGQIPPVLGGGISNRRLVNRVRARADEIDPYAAARAEHLIGHGTHLTNVADQLIRRDATDFSKSNRLVKLGVKVGETPLGRKLRGAWKGYTQAVFKANEKLIENPVQKALVGKALREWNKGLRITDDIVDDLARGYIDPAKSIQLAKRVEQTTGQWTGNSPMARTILSGYAPFGMWTRAATKYVLYTLPVQHPIKTAILTNIAQMTEDERKALGLSIFADEPLPARNRGDIPLPGGGIMPVSTLSSFGYFGDIGGNVAGSVLPQAGGVLNALRGKDPFGGDLESDDGTPLPEEERFVVAGLQLMGITVPFVGKAQYADADKSFIDNVLKNVPFTPQAQYDAGLVDYLRSLANSQQISVPTDGGSSGSSSSSSSSSSGASLPPWYGGSSSSSSSGGTSLPPWYGGQ